MQGLAEALAAMAPCLRLYAFLGTRLSSAQPPLRSPYREWAAMYSTPAYLQQPAAQEALLARAASQHRHRGARQPWGLSDPPVDSSLAGTAAGRVGSCAAGVAVELSLQHLPCACTMQGSSRVHKAPATLQPVQTSTIQLGGAG